MISVDITMKELRVVHDLLASNWDEFEEMCKKAGVDAEEVYQQLKVSKEDLDD
jgi:hypothetical protein